MAARRIDTRVRSARNCSTQALGRCDVVVTPSPNRLILIRTMAGDVYTAGRDLDMAEAHGVNDSDRRVWCNLKGISMAALKAEMAAKREDDAKRLRDGDLARVHDLAKRLGLKVVKARKSTRGAARHA